jgi:hypothetical protein
MADEVPLGPNYHSADELVADLHDLLNDLAPAFEDGVGQLGQHQLDRANAVVVAGNRQVHRIGIAIGVDEGHGGDAHALGFLHCDVFALRVHDDERVGQPVHFFDAE